MHASRRYLVCAEILLLSPLGDAAPRHYYMKNIDKTAVLSLSILLIKNARAKCRQRALSIMQSAAKRTAGATAAAAFIPRAHCLNSPPVVAVSRSAFVWCGHCVITNTAIIIISSSSSKSLLSLLAVIVNVSRWAELKSFNAAADYQFAWDQLDIHLWPNVAVCSLYISACKLLQRCCWLPVDSHLHVVASVPQFCTAKMASLYYHVPITAFGRNCMTCLCVCVPFYCKFSVLWFTNFITIRTYIFRTFSSRSSIKVTGSKSGSYGHKLNKQLRVVHLRLKGRLVHNGTVFSLTPESHSQSGQEWHFVSSFYTASQDRWTASAAVHYNRNLMPGECLHKTMTN